MSKENHCLDEIGANLRRLREGDARAVDALLPSVYEELKRLASNCLRGSSAPTLQATALVHEAYLRLAAHEESSWKDRAHFMALASRAMRQILIDHLRARKSDKRGGAWDRVTLDRVVDRLHDSEIDASELMEALAELEDLDRDQAAMVELRIFGGLTLEEIAEVKSLSMHRVKSEWQFARAWLKRRLGPRDG